MPRQALRPTAREAIVEAAIEQLTDNPGASLAEIVVRAGVGRASLHRHFAPPKARKKEDEIDAGLPSSWAVANIDAQIWLAWSEVAAEPVQLLPREAYVEQSWQKCSFVTGDLKASGDYLTLSAGLHPLIVLRDESGALRIFQYLSAPRHRTARRRRQSRRCSNHLSLTSMDIRPRWRAQGRSAQKRMLSYPRHERASSTHSICR